jgi:hypothetical protein
MVSAVTPLTDTGEYLEGPAMSTLAARLSTSKPNLPLLRQRELLRLLARMEFVPARHLHALVAPQLHETTFWRWLQNIHQQRLIWRHPVDARRLPGAMGVASGVVPPKTPLLYGLTARGRDWLADQSVEDDTGVLERAITRDWKQPELKIGQLAHDLLVVDWCCRALAELRRSGLLSCVEIVMEYVSAVGEHNQPLQRFDALMLIQFAPGLPEAQSSLSLPWEWAERSAPGRLAWALEIDRGTEKLVTLLGKAVMYRDLTITGHYLATLGVNPLPVVITPTMRRAAQIAREWVDGWPDGRGIVASLDRLRVPHGGVLWGGYKTLGFNPARDATLWDDVGITRAHWGARECDR